MNDFACAMILFMILGVGILLSALILFITKDPRDSVFMYRYPAIKKLSREEARAHARKIARILAIVGLVVLVLSGIGLLVSVLLPAIFL